MKIKNNSDPDNMIFIAIKPKSLNIWERNLIDITLIVVDKLKKKMGRNLWAKKILQINCLPNITSICQYKYNIT